MIEDGSTPIASIDDIKIRISQISQKPLDLHPQEFENIHSDLTQVLSGIDGL
ncbi:unannotated protein [freshwater metagenome]|uniref:Unannotated protein n=1 Tax=freshwater metagenome TaxID=449393 RepID=A0A6J6TBJ8_9ZZZZ